MEKFLNISPGTKFKLAYESPIYMKLAKVVFAVCEPQGKFESPDYTRISNCVDEEGNCHYVYENAIVYPENFE